jgi:hypothetical protein
MSTLDLSQHGRSTDSRLSESDRADRESPGYRPHKGDRLKQLLTREDGVWLREDVRDVGALEGARPVSWRDSVREWRQYILDNEDVDTVFKNTETGQYYAGSSPHRFDPEYSAKQYAKLKDLERGLSADYGRRLHTAMLTLTASSSPDGEALPPVDHLNALDGSWEAVRRALARQLDGRRWEYLAILEPHKSGYLHIHIAVFVDGVVTPSTFAPVIDAHLRNCDLADREAHRPDDDSTISVRHAGAERDLDNDDQLDELACYLAEYLGAYGEDPLDLPDHVQMSNAVLWATGKQRWRPSNGAQQYMKAYPKEDPDEESPWELAGMRRGTEYYPAVGDAQGGVDRFVTTTEWDPPD